MKNKRIVASLEYGLLLSLWLKAFYCIIICVGIVFLPFFIFYAVNNDIDKIFIPIIDIIICIIFLWILFKDYKAYKIYKKSKKDAVVLDAMSIITDKDRSPNLIWCAARISVQFYYNGEKIIKKSGKKGYKNIFDGSKEAGYSSVFRRYGDRKIKILYSPCQDHVFILKD